MPNKCFILQTSAADRKMLEGLSQAAGISRAEVVRRAIARVTVEALKGAQPQ